MSQFSLTLSIPKEKQVAWDCNEGYYFQSFPENEYQQGYYLYHTTTFQALKCILKDGFLLGSAEEKRKHNSHALHDGIICFTTNPLRHTSGMPQFFLMGYIGNTCYLRWPLRVLERLGVRPTVYELGCHDLEAIAMQTPLLLQFIRKKEDVEEEYGEDFPSFKYSQWMSENEFRIVCPSQWKLPPETEAFVSSPQQEKALSGVAKFPVRIDPILYEIRRHLCEGKYIPEVRRYQSRIEDAIDAIDRSEKWDELWTTKNKLWGFHYETEEIVKKRDRKRAKKFLLTSREELESLISTTINLMPKT